MADIERGGQPQQVEGEQRVDLGRRKFIAKLVVGGALSAGGGFEYIRSLNKLIQHGKEADSLPDRFLTHFKIDI